MSQQLVKRLAQDQTQPFCYSGYALCCSSVAMAGTLRWTRGGGGPSLTGQLLSLSFLSLKYLLKNVY